MVACHLRHSKCWRCLISFCCLGIAPIGFYFARFTSQPLFCSGSSTVCTAHPQDDKADGTKKRCRGISERKFKRCRIVAKRFYEHVWGLKDRFDLLIFLNGRCFSICKAETNMICLGEFWISNDEYVCETILGGNPFCQMLVMFCIGLWHIHCY